MNRSVLSVVAVMASALLLCTGIRLHSQEVVVVKKSPQEQLLALKAANAVLLEKQQKSLQKLDEIKQQADQLRIMSKNH